VTVSPTQALGETIVVQVLRHEADLHVALMGSSGTELEGEDVAPDQQTVILPALTHAPTGRLAVVATFTKGYGQETIVRPISFTAR
jgi:hypothetical protein